MVLNIFQKYTYVITWVIKFGDQNFHIASSHAYVIKFGGQELKIIYNSIGVIEKSLLVSTFIITHYFSLKKRTSLSISIYYMEKIHMIYEKESIPL